MQAELVLATGNAGKLRELQSMLAGSAFTVTPQTSLGVPEAAETGLSFVENAILKARNAAAHTGRPAIADDSGLCLPALGGAPGIYSARYAGAGASDQQNLETLLAATAHLTDMQRGCHFICVMAYLAQADDPVPIICEGRWSGQLARAPRGTHGFGYDPIFVVPGHGCTAAELPPAIKHQLSHRGQALRELVARLLQTSSDV